MSEADPPQENPAEEPLNQETLVEPAEAAAEASPFPDPGLETFLRRED